MRSKKSLQVSRPISLSISRGLASAVPDRALTVSQWAEAYRVVSEERVANLALAGKWTNAVTPYLTEVMDAVTEPDVNEIVFIKSSQVGGPLTLDTEIPTPDGWTTMGAISAGDRVFDENGEVRSVVGVSEVFYGNPCFEVHFSDGTRIECDDRHLWTVQDKLAKYRRRFVTVPTSEIARRFKLKNRNRYAIPVARPLDLPEADLPIDPYLLGVWLGDGNSSSNQITQTPEDAEEIAGYIRESGMTATIRRPSWCKGNVVNMIVGEKDFTRCGRGHLMTPENRGSSNACKKCASLLSSRRQYGKIIPPIQKQDTLFSRLREQGLIRNKHIPSVYLRASYRQRLALLQGLMDTDGYCDGDGGRCEISIAHEQLAKGVEELLAGLGIKFSSYHRLSTRGFSGAPRKSSPVMHYRYSFTVYDDKQVFRLKRKARLLRGREGRRATETEFRRIVNVVPIESRPTRCIAVDSPSHLFLAGRQMVPTHNTELLNNIIGYFIHTDPATILYVCENEGKARAWSVESFAPMIRDTPVLAQIFGDARQRDSSNMIEAKAFRGGHFALAWSTSPATLSSRPRRVVLTDETDAFEPTKEGDPVKLAEARTKTAKEQRKIVHVTTPRDKEGSRVYPLWEDSDQCLYFVPCPHCEEMQALRWGQVRWEPDAPSEAYYACEHCGAVIENDDKEWMIERGRWRPTNAAYRGNRRAFWINEIYSPFTTWGEMAVAFLEAKRFKDTFKVFCNTRLAQFWEDKAEEIHYADLTFHREEYGAEVPHGVELLTAGVDVQDDRLEMEIVGWGRDLESWSIDYKVIYGSPALSDVWESLADMLEADYLDPDGNAHRIRAACIDSGGHHTETVYRFCKANSHRRWWAIKGASVSGKPLVSKPSFVGKNKTRLFTIGTDVAKDEIFSFLKVEESGSPGFCHFPEHYDERHFKMLCSEKKVTKYVSGVPRQQWVKVSESARNEFLDCRVYATAARAILNPQLGRMTARNADKRAVLSENRTDRPESDPIPAETAPVRRQLKRFRPAGAGDWR